MKNSPYQVRSSLSFFLAKALIDVFPAVEIISISATDLFFQVKFFQKGEIHPELEILVEERLKGLLKEDPLLEKIEMERRSAFEYFKFHKQNFMAEEAIHSDSNLLSLLRHDQFLLLHSGKIAEKIPFPLFIKIYDLEEQDECYLLQGAFSEEKKELKDFTKKLKEFEKRNLFEKESDLFYEESFLPKGYICYRNLEEKWNQAVTSFPASPIKTNAPLGEVLKAHLPIANRLKTTVAEWAVLGEDLELDLIHSYTSFEKSVPFLKIFLQMIEKTVKLEQATGTWALYDEESDFGEAKQWRQEVKCLRDALKGLDLHWIEINDRAPPYQEELKSYLSGSPLIVYQWKGPLGESIPGPFLRVLIGEKGISTHSSLNKGQSLAVSRSFAAKDVTIQTSLFGPLKAYLRLSLN